ncbi:RtcB family protein [Candidatus Enterococcus murrayae]|uniref:3'-phosphate/5'-hydroxy nucleic acid ligase n=1 Tax=Candidatus Enterococcus murrayae TaxID=2815321 RepID=A0ABS3HQX6_9ENTE|nr:RtcB family protein [Enterococcus sp. MJM16]MBO0454983.1 RtcB family protein [Enterococcus sp. MJM16]
MLTIKGKYNTATVYADNLTESTVGQITTLCNQSFAKNAKIRIMPDTHSGSSCVIGTTMTVNNQVVPNLVGVDIGCGVYVAKVKKGVKLNFDKLDRIIRNRIPSGHHSHNKPQYTFPLENVQAPIHRGRALRSIGTLGGGNHFIEVNEGSDGFYLVIHSGSRVLGKEIAEYHQEIAYQKLSQQRKDIKLLAKSTKDPDEKERLLQQRELLKIPYELSYVSEQDLDNYLSDMRIAQQYAAFNRQNMALTILKAMKWEKSVIESFDSPHNYIDLKHMILRKGAASARRNEKMIVPLNMKDGSIIGIGKGNEKWNYSGPHGAGRMMSRSQARASISLDNYQHMMRHVWTTSVSKKTLDEAPKAYKSKKQLMRYLPETMEVKEIIRPLYNFKS